MRKKTMGYLPIIIAFSIAGFLEEDFKIDGVEEEEEEEEGEEGPGDNNWWSHQRTLDLKFLIGGDKKAFRRKYCNIFNNDCTDANLQGSENIQFTEEEHEERNTLWWTILAPLLISDIKSSVGTAVLERLRLQGEGGGDDTNDNDNDSDNDSNNHDNAGDDGSIGLVQGLLALNISSDEQAR
jgi:hypothetical protein